jgi:hypothetical protein
MITVGTNREGHSWRKRQKPECKKEIGTKNTEKMGSEREGGEGWKMEER